jgi:hypothetical protein
MKDSVPPGVAQLDAQDAPLKREWRCAGCGLPAPKRRKACDCYTRVVVSGDVADRTSYVMAWCEDLRYGSSETLKARIDAAMADLRADNRAWEALADARMALFGDGGEAVHEGKLRDEPKDNADAG